jgi:dipeptide/tripeptide permease
VRNPAASPELAFTYSAHRPQLLAVPIPLVGRDDVRRRLSGPCGKRRYLVALCLLLTAAGLLIPFARSLAAVIMLVSIAASFGNVGPAANGALVGDLLRSPADAGRAFAFLVLGGNSFGLLAPVVTGYIVEATGSFNSAFILAGTLALIGAAVSLALARTPIGEVPAPAAAQPRLAG